MRKKSKFFKGTLIYCIILASVMVLLMAVLYLYLMSFQKSRPDDLMKRFARNEEVSELLKGKIDSTGINESEDVIIAAISDMVSNKSISYLQNFKKSTDENPVYVVKIDNEPVMEFVLMPGEDLGFGLKGWAVKSINFAEDVKTYKNLEVMVPRESKVYVNGNEINPYVEKTQKDIELLASLKNQGIVTDVDALDSFALGDFFQLPGLRAVDVNGNELTLVNEKENIYINDFAADEEFVASVKDRVLSVIEPYAMFQSNDISFSKLSPYLGDGTELKQRISSSDVRWFAPHNGCAFSNEDAKDFKKYSDTCFSCNVTFTQSVVTEIGKVDYEGDYNWVFVKMGNEWYLCDMVTNDVKNK